MLKKLLPTLLAMAILGCTAMANKQTATSYINVEQDAFQGVNQQRALKGLNELTLDTNLSTIARSHSDDMAVGKTIFGHAGFDKRAKQLKPYTMVSENVAMILSSRSDPAAGAIEKWLSSHEHNKNMMGGYQLTGIGVARSTDGRYLYFTQLFLRR